MSITALPPCLSPQGPFSTCPGRAPQSRPTYCCRPPAWTAVGAAFLRVGDEPLRAEVYLLSAGAGFLVVVAAAAATGIVAHRRRWSVE